MEQLLARPNVAPTDSSLIRVIIAEDHALFAEALTLTLEKSGLFEILACVTSGDALVDAWRQHQPDLVITDLSMPPTGGVEAARQIRALDDTARIMIVSAFDDRHLVTSAMQAGVVGFLSKCAPGDELVTQLAAAAAGETAFSPTALKIVIDEARGVGSKLTPRQIEILTERSRGLSNAEIASKLHLGVTTVKTHLADAYDRLDVGGANAAIRRAIELGLIEVVVS